MANDEKQDRCLIAVNVRPTGDMSLVRRITELDSTGNGPSVIAYKDAIVLDFHGKQAVANCIAYMNATKQIKHQPDEPQVHLLAKVCKENGDVEEYHTEPIDHDHLIVYERGGTFDIGCIGNGLEFEWFSDFLHARSLFTEN